MKFLPALFLLAACHGKDDTGTRESRPDTDDEDTDTDTDTDSGEPAVATDVSFSFSASELSTRDVLTVSATATWSDGSSSDVAGEATYTSSDEAVLRFFTPGRGQPLDQGTAHVTASYEGFSAEADLTISMAKVGVGDLVINELLADPPGDSNLDGVTDAVEDEFVELANHADATLDIGGVLITDTDIEGIPRHTVPAGTILAAGEALLVFGGGDGAAVASSTCQVQIATNADSGLQYGLALNNEGDLLTVWLPDGVTKLAEIGYGDAGPSDAIENASLTLNPDVWGTTYTHHRYATNSIGDASPCTYADGSAFPGPEGRYAP